jgi:hypothetical protein
LHKEEVPARWLVFLNFKHLLEHFIFEHHIFPPHFSHPHKSAGNITVLYNMTSSVQKIDGLTPSVLSLTDIPRSELFQLRRMHTVRDEWSSYSSDRPACCRSSTITGKQTDWKGVGQTSVLVGLDVSTEVWLWVPFF